MAIFKSHMMCLNTLRLEFLRLWEKRLRSLPGFQLLQVKKVHQILREIQEVNSSKLRIFSQILHIGWQLGYDWQQYSHLFH
jgi:hypothetical protein